MSDFLKKFGTGVKKLREEKGLSQEKLAELAKLHRTYIGFIERAERNITIGVAEKVASAFEMSLGDLIKYVDKSGKK